MIAEDLKSLLQQKFPELAARPSLDWPAFDVPIENLVSVVETLRDDYDYDMLVDATAIDNGLEASPRYTVVYHLYGIRKRAYVRIAADCLNDEEPTAPTVTGLFAGADWHEREVFDMFGIRYEGHPDMRRILMWDEYPYHPLRKDFPLAGFDSELNDEEVAEETGARVRPAPMAGGPFVAPQKAFMSEREPRAKDESWNEKKEKPDQ